MRISEVVQLTGLSKRTLHYYDEIRLVAPEKSENGYREYSEGDLDRLQLIMFCRAVDMSIKDIKKLFDSEKEMNSLLQEQRTKLIHQQQSITQMIQLIDKTIQAKEEGVKMTAKEKFDGINFNDNQYEAEAREKFGDKAVDESNAKLGKLTNQGKENLSIKWKEMFAGFDALKDMPVESETVMNYTEKFYRFLNDNFGTYSLNAFYGLGEMYVQDERFTENINQYGEGLAEYMSRAMKHYAMMKNEAK